MRSPLTCTFVFLMCTASCGDDGSARAEQGDTSQGATDATDTTAGPSTSASTLSGGSTTGGMDAGTQGTTVADTTLDATTSGGTTTDGTTSGDTTSGAAVDDTTSGDTSDDTGGVQWEPQGVCSVDAWCWVFPLPHGNTVHDWWQGPSALWAVGGGGLIAMFDGDDWSYEPPFVWTSLRGVWGAAQDDIWAVGDVGTIVHFDGVDWYQVPSPTTTELRGIWGFSGDDVWAVGDQSTVLHYDGTSWSQVTLGLNMSVIHAIWGSGPDDIWIAGGAIAHYDGDTWSWSDVPQFGWTFTDISGSGPDDIWAVTSSNHGIYRWTGGPSWQPHTPHFGALRGVHAVDPSTAWVVGDNVIRRWDGDAWSTDPSFTQGPLHSVVQVAADEAWAGGAAGTTMRWDGSAWTLEHGNPLAPTHDYVTVHGTQSDVWAVGYRFGSFDGETWNAQQQPTFSIGSGTWGDDGQRWIVATPGSTSTLWHHDGVDWTQLDLPVGGAFRAIWGLSPDDYWLAGNGSTGGPIHYDGSQWSQVASGNVHFVALHGVSPTDVWFAGFGERVAYWNGTTLTTIRSGPTNIAYRGVWAADTQNVWAVGGQRFDHWDGQTWTDHQINLGKQSFFEGIDGVAVDDIWVVGDAYPGAGIIFHFDGTQWTQSISGAGNSLADVWMANSNDVWAVGLAGSVLRRVSP